MSIFDAATFDILQIEAKMFSDMNTCPKNAILYGKR